jgi:hypothetical protein
VEERRPDVNHAYVQVQAPTDGRKWTSDEQVAILDKVERAEVQISADFEAVGFGPVRVVNIDWYGTWEERDEQWD